MRPLLLSALLVCSLAACTETAEPVTKELKRLGNACEADAECGSGQCLHGACTRPCGSQGDCPWGLDCGRQAPEDEGATCYAALYPQPVRGGFGTPCALFAEGCGASENPCAQGFSCRAELTCDPEAICTASCAKDTDCPASMFCATEKDKSRVCLPRRACAPCENDDQCPDTWACVLGEDGARFCAKPCAEASDCLKPEKDPESGEFMFEPFEVCAVDRGDQSRMACQPSAGRCTGKGPIETQPAGGVCSPCREGFPEDCGAGHGCVESQQGEWFCSTNCELELTRAPNGNYGISDDSCPEGTHCYLGGYVPQDCGAKCTVESICNADPTYMGLSCMPSLAD